MGRRLSESPPDNLLRRSSFTNQLLLKFYLSLYDYLSSTSIPADLRPLAEPVLSASEGTVFDGERTLFAALADRADELLVRHVVRELLGELKAYLGRYAVHFFHVLGFTLLTAFIPQEMGLRINWRRGRSHSLARVGCPPLLVLDSALHDSISVSRGTSNRSLSSYFVISFRRPVRSISHQSDMVGSWRSPAQLGYRIWVFAGCTRGGSSERRGQRLGAVRRRRQNPSVTGFLFWSKRRK